MISIVETPVLSTTLPCFHFDTVSSVQVSSRSVQVIMICYSENQPSFVAAIAYVMNVLHTVLQMMVLTAVNLLELATMRFPQLKLTPLATKEFW